MKKKFNVQSRLRTAIRRVWLWSDVRREALVRTRIRPGYHRCEACAQDVHYKSAKVDHIDPFTPLKGFQSLSDWGPALVRMFDLSNHQTLCDSCHQKKTKEENRQRREYRYGRGQKL